MTTYAEAHQFAQRTATKLLAPFAVIATGNPEAPFNVFSAKVAVVMFPDEITTIVNPRKEVTN